jgi:hypothetical protein
MTIRITARVLSLAVMLAVGALAMDHAAAESQTKSSGAAEVKQKQTAATTHVVRDHRGQPNNAAPPIHDAGWGNDSGATVRDHRQKPCLPELVPGGGQSPLGGDLLGGTC